MYDGLDRARRFLAGGCSGVVYGLTECGRALFATETGAVDGGVLLESGCGFGRNGDRWRAAAVVAGDVKSRRGRMCWLLGVVLLVLALLRAAVLVARDWSVGQEDAEFALGRAGVGRA